MGTAATPTVLDQVGRPVEVRPVARILTLAPDVTELVFALGAGSLLPAVPRSADFPSAVATLERFDELDAEAVVSRRPDLVIATTAGTDPRLVDRLASLGVRVATTDVTSCDRLAEAARLLGVLLGRTAEGERLSASMTERCAAATERARRLPSRRALYVVWWDPLIVAAPGTFHDDLLRRGGLVNLAPASAGRYPLASRELLLDPRLEVVVAPDEPDLRTMYHALLDRPEGRRLAGRQVRTLWLPADPASRPGPRLVDALEALVQAREATP